MMRINLPLGNQNLNFFIDSSKLLGVFEPVYQPAKALAEELISQALDLEIGNLLSRGQKISIIVDDITRPTPTKLILKILGNYFREYGVAWENVKVIFAYGGHRQHTKAEIDFLLGDNKPNYQIIHHDANDKSKLIYLGTTNRGTPLWVNKDVVEADLRILSGSIKPHNQAGFTGGGKAIVPGCAGIETIIANHSFKNVSDPNAVVGVIKDNPIREDIEEVLKKLGPSYLVNVTLNQNKEIINCVAGDVIKAHRYGCENLTQQIEVHLNEKCDIAVVGCPPPIDINLYQAMNALTAPVRVKESVINQGGTILLVGEFREQYGQQAFYDLLLKFDNPNDLLKSIRQEDCFQKDQYAAQIWASTVANYDVFIYAPLINEEMIKNMFAKKVEDVELFIQNRPGKVAVFPQAPYCIPNLKS